MIKIARYFKKAIVFNTQKQLDGYLSEHPNADRSLHTVRTNRPINQEQHNQLMSDAKKGDKSILHHEHAGTAQDVHGKTPLHYLAMHGVNILDHPQSSKTKDNNGDTPLHQLAAHIRMNNTSLENEIKKHPMVNTVKNNAGQTPMSILNRKRLL